MLLPMLVVLGAAPVITLQDGVLSPPLGGTPAQAAMTWAQQHRAELGLDSRSTLTNPRTFSTRFGGTVRLEQQVGGLTVFNADVAVTFDAQQRVVRVANSLRAFGATKLQPTLDARQAVALASRAIDGAWLTTAGQPYGGATARAFVVGGELHAGFWCFVPTLKTGENWHVAIDATDGAVLFTRNRAWRSNAAQVYAVSPGGLDAGVGVTAVIDTQLDELDGGFLSGSRLRALNCCPTVNCDPDAGVARAVGQLATFGGTVNIDVAICDQRPRATNDATVHASGDYVYAPVDPPGTAAPSIDNPADFDEFAEVNAYFHVNKAYARVRALSMGPLTTGGPFSPFVMRATPDLPAVWVNVADADLQNAQPNAQGVYVSNTLSRTENAMYLARENMEYLLMPPQVLNSDALVIYQGQYADFAYDGPVLWHEFGHGVIHSTSDYDTHYVLDAFSANDEAIALNEGMADVISMMTGRRHLIGDYVGPRIDLGDLGGDGTGIRDLENTWRCPDVLWGESHQDSQHFTGAVWDARQQFLDVDDGDTFDAAVYAALVSFPKDVTFGRAANLIAQSVGLAFPQRSDAAATVLSVFTTRGVLGCSKALDVTDPATKKRPYYSIPGTDSVGLDTNQAVPGPFQFYFSLPHGAKRINLSGLMGGFSNGGSRLQMLAGPQRVLFTHTGTTLSNDAQWTAVPDFDTQSGEVTGALAVDLPCGSEVYVALGNVSRRDRQLYELQLTVDPADTCPEVDAGSMLEPDAGQPEPDAGQVDPVTLTPVPDTLGAAGRSCGCTSVSPLAVLGALLWLARRKRGG